MKSEEGLTIQFHQHQYPIETLSSIQSASNINLKSHIALAKGYYQNTNLLIPTTGESLLMAQSLQTKDFKEITTQQNNYVGGGMTTFESVKGAQSNPDVSRKRQKQRDYSKRLMSAEPSLSLRYNNAKQTHQTLLKEMKSDLMTPTGASTQGFGQKMSTSQLKLLSPTSGSQLLTIAGKQSLNASKKVKIEDITPELAAEIVKNFILPMFESDTKKHLRSKNSKLGQSKTRSGLAINTN